LKKIAKPNKLIIIILISFSVIITSIFLIDWMDENVINPRIWKDWSCEKMKNFALTFEDEKLTDFQRARFHDDLSLCLR